MPFANIFVGYEGTSCQMGVSNRPPRVRRIWGGTLFNQNVQLQISAHPWLLVCFVVFLFFTYNESLMI